MMDIIKLCMIKITFWDAVLKYIFLFWLEALLYTYPVGILPVSFENRNLIALIREEYVE